MSVRGLLFLRTNLHVCLHLFMSAYPHLSTCSTVPPPPHPCLSAHNILFHCPILDIIGFTRLTNIYVRALAQQKHLVFSLNHLGTILGGYYTINHTHKNSENTLNMWDNLLFLLFSRHCICVTFVEKSLYKIESFCRAFSVLRRST